jgi:hypothetical protein
MVSRLLALDTALAGTPGRGFGSTAPLQTITWGGGTDGTEAAVAATKAVTCRGYAIHTGECPRNSAMLFSTTFSSEPVFANTARCRLELLPRFSTLWRVAKYEP